MRACPAIALAAAACAVLAVTPVYADKVTSKSITPVAGVTGKCAIETEAKDKSLTYSCEFTNTTNMAVRFVQCAMADLNDKKIEAILDDGREMKRPPGTKKFHLKQVGGNNGKLVCEVADPKGGALSPASVYFGCQEVTLRPGEKNKKVTYATIRNYKVVTQKQGTPDQEVDFNKLKAGDFTVVYTDQVDLTGTPMKKFDPDGTCKDTARQGNFIDFDTASIAEGVRSQWAFEDKSFVDPIIVYQPIVPASSPLPCDANGDGVVDLVDVQAIFAARNLVAAPGDPRDVDRDGRITVNDARICTLRLTRQYTSYNDPPCLPTGFPARVPDRPACPVRNAPLPPTSVDLNLFTWYTETEPPGEEVPAVLDVATQGDTLGVRIETVPAAGEGFNMLGSVDLFGTLSVCSSLAPDICLAPIVEEGRRLDVTVNVTSLDPDAPSFVEGGQFIQDTQPPRVVSSSAQFDGSGNLTVSALAVDDTTSPIGAEVWFSSNNGLTWRRRAMAATPDTLDEVSTRSFAATIGPYASGQRIRYFVVVNDGVSNVVVFGIGEVVR